MRRSFKQNAPYDLNYAGSIGGNGLKEAFLARAGTRSKAGKVDPRSLLTYMLKQLVGLRELERVRLTMLGDYTAPGQSFFRCRSGKACLPILAAYAAYRQMVGSGTSRYRRMNLRGEMESPTMAGSRLGSIGDIEVTESQRRIGC